MIVAAGLTPAWQQILVFGQFQHGEVNRAKQGVACASGKVLNVARACDSLGFETVTIAPIGGVTGNAIEAEFQRDGIDADWIRTQATTRTCTTVIESSTGVVTELVENATALEPSVLDRFIDHYHVAARTAKVAVLSGSLSPDAPKDFYATLMADSPARVILDARGPELLAALPYHPLLVKPNRDELARTVDRELDTEKELHGAMDELLGRGAQWVLVTQGAGPIWLRSNSESHRFDPDTSGAIVNPIGCGDCLAAGLAVATASGASVPQAVPFGMSAARVNAQLLLPARLTPEAVAEAGRRESPSPAPTAANDEQALERN